jgi:tRNA U38,U39,U40 pseudouridine synthase TruA
MVSSLINLDKNQIKEMLYLKKRYKIKPAIPNGLYLAKIKY